MGIHVKAVYDFPVAMIRLSASLNLASHGSNCNIGEITTSYDITHTRKHLFLFFKIHCNFNSVIRIVEQLNKICSF